MRQYKTKPDDATHKSHHHIRTPPPMRLTNKPHEKPTHIEYCGELFVVRS